MASVTITKRGEQRAAQRSPVDLQVRRRSGRGRRRRYRRRRRQPRPAGRLCALQRSIRDRAAHVLPRPRRRPTCRCGASASGRRCAFRTSLGLDATACRLVHGEADLLPVAGRRSLRRLPRAAGAVAGDRSAAAGDHGGCSSSCSRRPASWPGTIRGSGCSKGLEQRVEVLHGTVPDTIEVREGRGRLRRRSVSRPEDRAVPRPAREPRWRPRATRTAACSMPSATTAGSRWRWRRREPRGAGGRHLGSGGRADPRQRRAATASPTSKRGR